MKSFFTILILSSAILALIDETPATNAVLESQKTDLVINTDTKRDIKVNTRKLHGLSNTRNRHARKARLTHRSNRKADDNGSSSALLLDVDEFSLEDFPTELQEDVETLQDAIYELDRAMENEDNVQVCLSLSAKKTIYSALEDYQSAFVDFHEDLIEDLIEEYEEVIEEEENGNGNRALKVTKEGRQLKRKHRKHRKH